jgi:hypothetical protein
MIMHKPSTTAEKEYTTPLQKIEDVLPHEEIEVP